MRRPGGATRRHLIVRLLGLAVWLWLAIGLHSAAWSADAMACPRPASGATVAAPPDLTSQGGVLRFVLHYQTRTDSAGRTLYCFATPDGLQSPTLRVQPGDKVFIKLVNAIPRTPAGTVAGQMVMKMTGACGDLAMTAASVNIHFHGLNIAPRCHQDEVLQTVINSGQSFDYAFAIPRDEPPGLYWYHPHIHGLSTGAVEGGASGAIVIGGIETVQPAVAGLPERLLVLRDQPVPGVVFKGEPNLDVSVNYVPVPYPKYPPAVIPIAAGTREFWRVLNASADTVMDLKLVYDGQAQTLQLVALDGVPTSSHDGGKQGSLLPATDVLIPPAGRAEFIMVGPMASVRSARLVTQAIDTGPSGDADPARPLARLQVSPAAQANRTMPAATLPTGAARFDGLDSATVTATRTLYFSEVGAGPGGGDGTTSFYITVNGAQPALFNAANPPAITTTQGAVEDWTIQNRSTELHEFHIHQIHFKLLARNGTAVPASERQMRDTVQVPYWSGSGPYPSVTLRMDFRGKVVGDFVYHCHILDHEDGGMMAIIRVLPRAG